MTINDLIVFIYESGICLAILFAMYWLFLRRETYFRFNRFYLLSTIIIAFTLPLGNLAFFENGNGVSAMGGISSVVDTIRIPAVTIAAGSDSALSQSFNWPYLAIVIYLIGASLLIVRTILGIVRVTILKKKGEVVYKDAYSIVYMKQKLAPFSFLRTIYLNEALADGPDKSSIISHERIHIRQKHTYDNLFVEFFLAIFWFNPFMWFLKGALRNTHEYLADNGVLVGRTCIMRPPFRSKCRSNRARQGQAAAIPATPSRALVLPKPAPLHGLLHRHRGQSSAVPACPAIAGREFPM